MSGQPNFFLLGAPKCGTTSLARYLQRENGVHICEPKEPFYYATDFKALREREGVTSAVDYAQLFSEGVERNGDASTLYLCSELAVPRILADIPEARFVVLVREPVEMLQSWHAHLLKQGYETEPDLMQAVSKSSREFAIGDRDMRNYGLICALGSQLQRLYDSVPREQVRVYWFDQLLADPSAVVNSVLNFLELPPTSAEDYPVHNEALTPRLGLIAGLVTNRRAVRTYKALFRMLGPRGPDVMAALGKRIFYRRGRAGRVTPGDLAIIAEQLRTESESLHALVPRTDPIV